ncbi:NIMA-related kinase 5 [Cryptosporidium ubiquitum]|uniref:non-specific serine/threonine protein kinase n=1 Tax=Cryptosporidium ubiquitum TaxID=857276 RepID=A0A1J4MLP2_9CRYT|nr:NIMA-related kinase 5 [Cryptosporidium ubiquitum]OII75161.1 NIMA-related kinase 5 [Cryptosporidium ubiquitum]
MKLTIPFLPRNSSFDFLHKNYRIIEYVGKGQFGNTYKVQNTIDYKIWLAKCIDLSQMDEDDKNRSLQEAEIMKSINHPFVIKCHESFMHDDVYLVIIMEYCERGDIGAVIDSCISKGTYLPEEKILNWCAQLAAGLYYLHNECRIIHRDIKPSNIFIRENGDLVIGDFGISRIMLSVTMPFTLTSIGTPQYMSPEMCENKPYTYKSDIWSFGCVMYELTCLKPPFSGDSLLSLAWKISFQEIEPLPSCYSYNLFKLIQRLLSRDPILRPEPIEILNNDLLFEFKSLSEFLPSKVANASIKNNEKVNVIINNHSEDTFNEGCNNQLEEEVSDDYNNTIQLDLRANSGSSIEMNDSLSFSDEIYQLYETESGQKNRELSGINQFTIHNSQANKQEESINSISSSPLSNFAYKCSSNENCFSGGEKIRGYCDRLTNYEHQYFSVLVGRIQHHILRYSEKMSSELCSEKEDILNFLIKSFKSCQSDLYSLDSYMTSEWFFEFVNELNVGLSENEVSLFLSYIGHYIYSENEDPYSECKKNESKNTKSSYKIRHTKSSGSLISMEVSKTMRSIDSRTNNNFLGNAGFNENIKYPMQNKKSNGFKMPKIYDFIEKIYSWNKIRFNNKLHDQRVIESNEASSLRFDKRPNLFPISPTVNYGSKKQNVHSIKPYFYLFITDWIQSILTPILALNNITQKSNQSVRRLKNITLKQGFHLFDQKAQGTLPRQHFRTVLYLILPKLTSVQLDWLYALAPKDFTGNVKYEQFLEFIDSIQNTGETRTSEENNKKEEILSGTRGRGKPDNLAENSNCPEGNEKSYMEKEQNSKTSINAQEDVLRSGTENSSLLTELQLQREKAQGGLEIRVTNEIENYVGGKANERSQQDGESEISSSGYNDLPILQQELYGFGIQDVVLLHYNSQACMRRPSPSPQLLARARNASFMKSTRRVCEIETVCQNKENNLRENQNITGKEVNQKLLKFKKRNSKSKYNSENQNLNINNVQRREHKGEDGFNVISSKRQNFFLNISKNAVGSLSKELESLIHNLQVERIYTCWITAKASESQEEDLFGEVFEKLTKIRLETSFSLDLLISNLGRMRSFDKFDSILELNNILIILKEELPLQRDAIDCILRVIDHMELSSEKEFNTTMKQDGLFLPDLFNVKNQLNSDASKVYKEIMKQAITNNIVLPISAKRKYKSSRSYDVDSASIPIQFVNNLKKNTDISKSQLASDSKVFDWTGKFLASFEFFGEATVNLIQCGINILENTRNYRQDSQLKETTLRDFSQLNFLIENYRQWSHLKEHVSRECAFVASIGANHDLKNDIETARIFLELLGARRFQVNVTWQQQSSTEQQLFRELFFLEESLWNNQKCYSQREDALSYTRKSDSELWLTCGEQTCGALHSTCNKFIKEIQFLL